MMKVTDRKALVEKLYKRFGGAIPKLLIHDALQVICNDLCSRLTDRESVSVKGFGILHTYEYGGHKGVDIASGETRMTEPFFNVRFVPHKNFSDLIDQKKSFFLKRD